MGAGVRCSSESASVALLNTAEGRQRLRTEGEKGGFLKQKTRAGRLGLGTVSFMSARKTAVFSPSAHVPTATSSFISLGGDEASLLILSHLSRSSAVLATQLDSLEGGEAAFRRCLGPYTQLTFACFKITYVNFELSYNSKSHEKCNACT